jgi:poly(hydroxyalkanoate) depolymerase family esterase
MFWLEIFCSKHFKRAALILIITFSAVAWADVTTDGTFQNSPAGWNTSWCIPPFGCQSITIGQTGWDSSHLPGTWSSTTYSNSSGSRKYYLYTPKNGAGAPLPLVVALHGCTQDVPTFATETGLNDIAEKYGFAVVYPEESSNDNGYECWNWFEQENVVRGQCELSIIMGIEQEVSTKIQIDTTRVFAAGFSSGGAMVSSLLACYSDIFSGGLINSGLEYQAAIGAQAASAAMLSGSSLNPIQSGNLAAACTGNGARLQNVLIIHGDQDPIVAPINSSLLLKSFTQMNDILDDGAANSSQSTQVLASHNYTVAGGGDGYKVQSYGGSNGAVHIVHVTVHGMGHAWSGGHQAGLYSDPSGPDAGEMMWQFLNQIPR